MAEKGVQKAFESPGVFWLPGKPEQTLTGTLRHTPGEGPQVTLLGSFDLSLISNFPVVHGVLENAPCTLFNLGQTSGKSSHGGLRQADFEADLLLVGEHVSSLDDPVFNGSLVRFGGLDEWVNFSAIKIPPPEGDIVTALKRFDLETQPKVVAKSDAIGGTVTLCGEYSGRFGHRYIDWQHHSFFEIAFDQPTSVRQASESIFELQHLFALLTWYRAPFSFWSVSRPVSNDPMNPSGKRWSGVYGHWPAASEDDKSSSHFLTYLAHVLHDLPQIISAWFQSPPAIKTARHLLTSIVRSKGQYLEFKFLALMQTVEALHRSLVPKTYMSAADYEVVRQTLVAAIPASVGEDHRTSLQSRIKYGNDLSLRTRFKELFLRLPEKLRAHICNDWKTFVGQAVDMRNALTHPNTDGSTAQPDPTQMWQASQRIKLLLTIVLLNELGFSFDKIEKVTASEQWRSLVRD